MNNIDRTINALNTALILLDAFVDGHEFTMHDYKELAATANELFGGRYSDSNVCYSASWVREHLGYFGIHKTGSREIEVVSSHSVYKRVYNDYLQHEVKRYAGDKPKVKTVEQFIYRMTDANDCLNFIAYRKAEIQLEFNNVETRIKRDKQYLEKLKQML